MKRYYTCVGRAENKYVSILSYTHNTICIWSKVASWGQCYSRTTDGLSPPPTAPAARQSARGTYYTKYICNSNPLSSHNDFLPSRKGASHHLAIRPNKTIRTTPTSCMIQRRQSNRGARGDWYDYIPFKASSNIKLYQNAVSVSHFWIHIRLQLT